MSHCNYRLDWKSWCVEPRISFEDVCPETCLNKFQSVNWISEDGFCASVDNYTGNVKLQESACATFKNSTRGGCEEVDFTEATTEYDEVTPCFIEKQSILSTESGEEVNQPYSGLDNQRVCGNAANLNPQVCGTTQYVVPFTKRSCQTNTGSNVLDTGLTDCELRDAEHQYCLALFQNGWSTFEGNEEGHAAEYVVLVSQTEIDNPPSDFVFTTDTNLAVKVE